MELYLNGQSISRQQIEHYGHGEWLVSFEVGELKVYAIENGLKDAVLTVPLE